VTIANRQSKQRDRTSLLEEIITLRSVIAQQRLRMACMEHQIRLHMELRARATACR
jgi:hypothetical protein